MGRTYAYIRVSSKDQNEARQLQALEGLGLRREHIFLDKQSGKDFCRPQYQRLLRRLRRGRPAAPCTASTGWAATTPEVLEQWRVLTQQRGRGSSAVLDMPLLDTTLSSRTSSARLIADLVLQLLTYVAQNEREAIRTRQAEGIAAKAAQALCVSRSTFYRHARACAAAEGQIFPRARRGERLTLPRRARHTEGTKTQHNSGRFTDHETSAFDGRLCAPYLARPCRRGRADPRNPLRLRN